MQIRWILDDSFIELQQAEVEHITSVEIMPPDLRKRLKRAGLHQNEVISLH